MHELQLLLDLLVYKVLNFVSFPDLAGLTCAANINCKLNYQTLNYYKLLTRSLYKKFKFIQEVRNNEKQRIVIDTLRNSFGELITISVFGKYAVKLSLHDKTSGGGLLLYIPRSFKPKERSDLTTVSESRFESIWVECQFNKKKNLINISYCPTKHLSEMFLSELALGIDCAAAENKRIILMGDYNIDFFSKERKTKIRNASYSVRVGVM